MRFTVNIILVALFLALPVTVNGTSDVVTHSDTDLTQSYATIMTSALYYDDTCTSLGPNCQSEISICMMDCCLIAALNPTAIHLDHHFHALWNKNKVLAAFNPKTGFRPPIV